MSEGNPAPSVVLRKEVVERLATTGPQVRSLVVSKLVDEEIEKRKVAVLSVLGKVEDKFKELKKAEKQGTVTYNSEGAPTTDPVFTKQQPGKAYVYSPHPGDEHIKWFGSMGGD